MAARWIHLLICLLLLAGPAVGANREAERTYKEGRRLQKQGKFREAFDAYRRAAELEPGDQRFIVGREVARQRAAFGLVNAGERLLRARQFAEAARLFEEAANVDPSNEFPRQELARAQAAMKPAGSGVAPPAEALPDESALPGPLALRPRPVARTWDLKGEARTIYMALGAEYGIQFLFDEGLSTSPVRLRLDNADFSAVIGALGAITKTFVAPLEERIAMVASDTQQKRQEFERLVLKTIEMSSASAPEQVTEIANVLRTVLDMRFVQASVQRRAITVRDTAGRVEAAERLIALLSAPRPEVMLELEMLQIDVNKARDLGLNLQLQTSISKVSPLGTVQTGFQVPLPQLFGKQAPTAGGSAATPLAAFGAGRSTFAITLPGATLSATLSESTVRSISTQTVRASDNLSSTLLVGERYPIMNATFSAIYASAAIMQQQQAGTLINPFPSFTFEDLGVKLRITPRIHAEGDVTLRVEAQVRALTGQNLNGVPTISNRETDQIVRVRDGEPAVISGILSRSETSSMTGVPLLSETPVLGYLFGQRSTSLQETEVVIVLTPHILHEAPGALAMRTAILWPTNYVPVERE